MEISLTKAMVIPAPTFNVLSTINGRIKIRTIEEAIAYAHTQGIFYWEWSQKDRLDEYFLIMARLMRSECRHKIAMKCYTFAHRQAWDRLTSNALYRSAESQGIGLDPYEIYTEARLHMLEIGNFSGLKRLKIAHHDWRKMAYLTHKAYKRSAEINIECRIEECFYPIEREALYAQLDAEQDAEQ